MMKSWISVASVASMVVLSGCQDKPAKPAANMETFSQGVSDYLAQKGKLCLAKYDWPVNVTPRENKDGARDALQMPVMQKLGLVSEADAMVNYKTEETSEAVHVRQYSLTDAGRKYYISSPVARTASDGKKIEHPQDLCVATLALDHVVGWEPPHDDNGRQETAVTYTYKLVDVAPWTRDRDAQRVFPMVARVVDGAGTMQLKAVFQLTDNGWVATNELR
jgi:hypothetical protein